MLSGPGSEECLPPCPNGGIRCTATVAEPHGACVDPLTDANNCGGCGNICEGHPTRPACIAGCCDPSVPGGDCVNSVSGDAPLPCGTESAPPDGTGTCLCHATGRPCTANAYCCTGYCAPTGSPDGSGETTPGICGCGPLGVACSDESDCCSGYCTRVQNGAGFTISYCACSAPGGTCGSSADCCSGGTCDTTSHTCMCGSVGVACAAGAGASAGNGCCSSTCSPSRGRRARRQGRFETSTADGADVTPEPLFGRGLRWSRVLSL
jgi:hypothetical protein